MMLAAFCQPEPAEKDKRVCFELRKVPKPSLAGLPAGTALIRTVAVSICGTDLWGANKSTGRGTLDYLKTIQPVSGGSGHEVIGRVVDLITPCSELNVGQLVLAMVPAYIKRIESIKNAFVERTRESVSVLPDLGGFAEYIVSHSCACIPLPGKSPLSNPLHFVAAQPLGTILHACKKLESLVGKDVAVVGQGQNGLIMTQMLANMGARRIVALDLFELRLQVSKQFKATHTINASNKSMEQLKTEVSAITGGQMCDVVVEMVGHQAKTLNLSAQLTKDYGTVLIFGLPPAEGEEGMTIRTCDFQRNLQYMCSHSPSMSEFEFAVELIHQGRFDPEPLFTHSMSFREFPKAYEMASEYKDGVIKIVVLYE